MANDENILGGTVEEVDSTNPLLTMDINDLRKYCVIFQIPASKNWKREDYLKAIRDKLQQVELITAAKQEVDKNAPPPGHSRIVIHKDPSPTASNRSVLAAVNGRIFQIPRGMEVVVPTPVVEVLMNSTTHTTVNTNPNANSPADERYEHVSAAAYPCSVIAATPGNYQNDNDQRQRNYALRIKFTEKYRKWPTAAELNEAISHGRITVED